MLRLIETPDEKKNAQQMLEEALAREWTSREKRRVAWRAPLAAIES